MISTLLLLMSPLAHAEVADRLLSVVGDSIVTSSDLEFEIVFSAYDVSPIPAFEDPNSDPLRRLEDMRILRELAGDLSVFRPSTAELDARALAFQQAFPDEATHAAFLTRWGLDEAGLREQLFARLVVERYLERNLGAPNPGEPDAVWTQRYEEWMSLRRSSVPAWRVGP